MQDQTNPSALLNFIVGRMFLSSLTPCNTTHFTRSVGPTDLHSSPAPHFITCIYLQCATFHANLCINSHGERLSRSVTSLIMSHHYEDWILEWIKRKQWKVRSALIRIIRGTSGELVRSWQQTVHSAQIRTFLKYLNNN